ncbi:hypothetical protein AAFF_G00211560 [Aldrovandia affinis]|uniref:Uncharacterized protein n=1 Tax=Aldrovandia affinis TaxID=143900 RepID=A0AAD7WV50_9TELE|nr:hypothetical protein AAFF_G00211560 [Aldrovandia affinis]
MLTTVQIRWSEKWRLPAQTDRDVTEITRADKYNGAVAKIGLENWFQKKKEEDVTHSTGDGGDQQSTDTLTDACSADRETPLDCLPSVPPTPT